MDPVFFFSLVDVDLEVGEFLELFFFDGVSYTEVFQYNGSNNGLINLTWNTANFQHFNVSVSPAFQVSTFKWFFRTTMDRDLISLGPDNDGIILDRIYIEGGEEKSLFFERFFNVLLLNQAITQRTYTIYFTQNMDANYTFTLRHRDVSGSIKDAITRIIQVNGTDVNLTVDATQLILGAVNDTLSLTGNVTAKDGGVYTFRWGAPDAPSLGSLDIFLSEINITDISFDNSSVPMLINATVKSINPVTEVSLQRGATLLGNMYLCAVDIYCFLDSDAQSPNGTLSYNITATDSVGFNETIAFLVNIPPIRDVLIYPFFSDEFYAGLGDTFTYSVIVTDLDGNLLTDADLVLNFTQAGQSFNMTYDALDQRYKASITFNSIDDFPFRVEMLTPFYQVSATQKVDGITLVREDYQACFQVFRDSNSSKEYVNDLATLLAFDRREIPSALRSLEQLDILLEGSMGIYNFSMFHAPYLDGEACVTLYDINTTWQFRLVDGTIRFDDNFAAPQIIEYSGLNLDLGDFKPEPNATYRFYASRSELRYSKIWNNLLPLTIFALVIALTISVGLFTGPIGAFITFISLLLLWLIIEVILWIFV